MELEFAIDDVKTDESYRFALDEAEKAEDNAMLVINWGPIIEGVLEDSKMKLPAGLILGKIPQYPG